MGLHRRPLRIPDCRDINGVVTQSFQIPLSVDFGSNGQGRREGFLTGAITPSFNRFDF